MQKWEYLFVYSDDSGWGLVAAAAVTSEPVKPVPTPMTPVQTPPDAAAFHSSRQFPNPTIRPGATNRVANCSPGSFSVWQVSRSRVFDPFETACGHA